MTELAAVACKLMGQLFNISTNLCVWTELQEQTNKRLVYTQTTDRWPRLSETTDPGDNYTNPRGRLVFGHNDQGYTVDRTLHTH